MVPRRIAIAALVLTAIALSLPTTAAPMAGISADPVADGVTVTTENSTNAEYVRTTETGDVAIDLSSTNPDLRGDGLNPDARTYVADAFRLRYDGDTAATVWLTSEAEGIEFRMNGRPLDASNNTVTLAPDESVPVGFVVDTTGEISPSMAEFTVHARVMEGEEGPTDVAGESGDTVSAGSDEPVTTRVDTPDETTRTLALRNTAAGRLFSLDLSHLEVARAGGGAVTLDELSVVSDGGDVVLDVAATQTNSTEPLPTESSAQMLGAVRVEERRGAVERATLRFGVDRAYLDATGISVEDLTMYRYDGTRWSERGIEVVSRTDERVVFEADTPGFSTFAVAVERPDLQVSTADLGTTNVAPGERVTVTAEVTNTGAVAGTQTLTVTLDGTPTAERQVELATGSSTNVTVRLRAPGPGTYNVRLGADNVGQLVVEESEAAEGDAGTQLTPNDVDATPTPSRVESPSDRTAAPIAEPAAGNLTETLWLVAGLLGLLVVLALVRRVE